MTSIYLIPPFIRSLCLLLGTFTAGFSLLYILYTTLELDNKATQTADLKKLLTRPRASDIRNIHNLLSFYITQYTFKSTTLFCGTYLLLQAFAIPGPVLLSILAGALFGRTTALVIVTICTVLGSALCRINFQCIGKPVFDRLKGVDKFKEEIRKSGDNLFWFFLFLRITPLLPNWFINMSSGNLHIPWPVFLAGTGIGLLPNNFIMVGIGAEIHESVSDGNMEILTFSPDRFFSLLCLGLVALLPVLARRILKRKFNTE